MSKYELQATLFNFVWTNLHKLFCNDYDIHSGKFFPGLLVRVKFSSAVTINWYFF